MNKLVLLSEFSERMTEANFAASLEVALCGIAILTDLYWAICCGF